MKEKAIAGIALVCVATGLIGYFLVTQSQEANYNIQVQKVSYAFPWLNVTLLANENLPKIEKAGICYEVVSNIVGEVDVDTTLEKGDRLNIIIPLANELSEGNNTVIIKLEYVDGRYGLVRFTVQV